MTATTLDTTTTARRDYEISEALHTVADLYYRGSIPEAMRSGLPVQISVHVSTAEMVEGFARQNTLKVTTQVYDGGSIHTRADLIIDPNGAVRVHVFHISEVEA